MLPIPLSDVVTNNFQNFHKLSSLLESTLYYEQLILFTRCYQGDEWPQISKLPKDES